MASFWSKRINMRTKRKVAKDLGVDEEKVQELIDGTRHIGGETMDKVLESINDEKENAKIRDLEILDWYTTTDLKALRKEWGYGQTELGDKLGIYSKTLNAVESKYQFRGHVSNNIRKLYDFYQNEFNKKIEPLQNNGKVRVKKPIVEINEETPIIEIDQNKIAPYVVNIDKTPHKVEYSKNQEYSEGVVIKIDDSGNLRYFENGKEIENISEIHLEKIGSEKPILEIKLTRLF